MAQIKEGRWVTPSGQGTSSAIELVTETLVGVYTPSVLDAAELRLQASQDGQNFSDVMDNGKALTFAGDTDAYISLDAAKLLGAAQVRLIHLDALSAPVNETAERVFRPVFRTFE